MALVFLVSLDCFTLVLTCCAFLGGSVGGVRRGLGNCKRARGQYEEEIKPRGLRIGAAGFSGPI